MKSMTITVQEKSETFFFKLAPLTDLEEFLENVSLIISPYCVKLGEEMGLWKII